MSKAEVLLAELNRRGFAVRFRGGTLQVKPFRDLPPALCVAIRSEKAALLRLLTEPEEEDEPGPVDEPIFGEHLPLPDPPFADDSPQEEPGKLTPEERASLEFILRWNGEIEHRASVKVERLRGTRQ